MPGHVAADDGEIRIAGARFVDDLTVEHHHQSVGKLQKLVKVFADQEHRRAAVACRHDLGMDLCHRREIKPKARIGGDQDIDLAGRSRAGTVRCTSPPDSSPIVVSSERVLIL